MTDLQWKIRRRLELGYFNDLNRMVLGRLRKIAPEDFDPASIAAISLDPSFVAAVDALVNRMLLNLDVLNARNWRAAANKAMRSKEIYTALREEIAGDFGVRWREIAAAHSAKIVSLPDYLAQIAGKHFTAEAHSGRRSIEIAQDIRGTLSSLTTSHIAMLARTEVSSASTALTRARSERIGVEWYQWATSQDKRVRQSHRLMTNVLVRWSDPPAPEGLLGIKSTLGHYHAGQCPNCRCPALPVVSLDEISWPCKVYAAGSITRMTRRQFEAMQGSVAA